MAASQTTNGKAFEWATAVWLSNITFTKIKMSATSEFARNCFESLSPETQAEMDKAAEAAVSHIYHMEHLESVQITGEIEIAEDKKGQTGDVRDVILPTVKGSVGISCKNNHDAFKHSRLSGSIDFVRKWDLSKSGCTDIYWNDIEKIFVEIDGIRSSSKGKATWKELPNVRSDFYKPLMQAFSDELVRQSSVSLGASKELCEGLVRYLIGQQDFYKVIRRKSPDLVEIQGFNLGGSLACSKTKFPSRVLDVETVSDSTINLVMDKGYSFSFRIHSASTLVERSLKLDVRAIGLPQDLYKHHVSFI
jgi:hypothetical protein